MMRIKDRSRRFIRRNSLAGIKSNRIIFLPQKRGLERMIMKIKIALCVALLAATPGAAFMGSEVPGTPECDAASERYADARSAWRYSSQWWFHYYTYQSEGCLGVGD
jgi:hypothetical protein